MTMTTENSDVPTRAQLKGGEATRAKILRHAERLFGDHGLDGATVRQIAIDAGVPVALIAYHFGSKEGLYRAIFEFRCPMIIDERKAGLRLADMETDLERKLELVVKALLVPYLHMRSTDRNSAFARVLAREVADPKSHQRGIIAGIFDPIAHSLMDGLIAALPGRSLEQINWGYQFMLGAMVFIMADTGRISRLSRGLCDPEDEVTTTAHIVSLAKAALTHSTVPDTLPATDPNSLKTNSGGTP
ncbi:MAG: TetR family transcriptional regulator [Mesorhizobium sp.]